MQDNVILNPELFRPVFLVGFIERGVVCVIQADVIGEGGVLRELGGGDALQIPAQVSAGGRQHPNTAPAGQTAAAPVFRVGHVIRAGVVGGIGVDGQHSGSCGDLAGGYGERLGIAGIYILVGGQRNRRTTHRGRNIRPLAVLVTFAVAALV